MNVINTINPINLPSPAYSNSHHNSLTPSLTPLTIAKMLIFWHSRQTNWRRNEQTFSQRCWPEPGAYFTVIVLYTSRQSQILLTTFIWSGPRSLSDSSLRQMKSHKTMTLYYFDFSFLSHDQLLLTSAGVNPDRMTWCRWRFLYYYSC